MKTFVSSLKGVLIFFVTYIVVGFALYYLFGIGSEHFIVKAVESSFIFALADLYIRFSTAREAKRKDMLSKCEYTPKLCD